ncbi:MotE family protein [Rhodospirillaceae bacterium SYSU D60014]|uniref:MotE family protein n=1 Tax=Virgifigura deserti TaxID=2268457 RepID=UPI000E672C1A
MPFRPRLLPAVLFVGALLLTVRVGDLWYELSVVAGSSTAAQTASQTPSAPANVPEAGAVQAGEPGSNQSAAVDERFDPFSYTDEEIEVLQALSQRREELEVRDRELQQRAALLAATEQRMDRKLEELKVLQATIEGLVERHDAEEEKKFKSLVKIYENMKPRDAAQIFEQLEMDVLLEVVGRMSERKVAPILAEMDPGKAKEVTFQMAQEQQLPIPK